MAAQSITAQVFRYNPATDAAPRYQEYEIAAAEPLSVQAIIRHIFLHLDRTLAFRNYNCYIGVCTCCLVKVNGKSLRSCCTLVKPGEEVQIGPINPDKVIRDLVTAF